MNINETLAKYFEITIFTNDYMFKEKIPKFLRESKPENKYKLAQSLIKELVKPHGKDKLYPHITELYEVENATMILTGKRDHVIHALNTFLLGCYINNYYLDNKVDMFQWKLAALFHDIAYPLEISQKIIERYFDKLNSIKNKLRTENSSPTMNLVPLNFEKLTNHKNALEFIQTRIYDWELDINVQKTYKDKISSNKICHGMLSALTVLYLIDLMYHDKNPQRKRQHVIDADGFDWDQRHFENHIVPACSAIFLHNLSDDAFEKIAKGKAPLPYLLKLCDELQTWDRPDQNTECLFSWYEVSGKDNERFIKFLKQKLSFDLENAPKIEHSTEFKTINVTSINNNPISLKLKDENSNIYIEIDGVRTDDFRVDSENGEINIYNAYNVDSPDNYDISIQKDMISFNVRSKWIRKRISKKIKCLKDPNIILEDFTKNKND